MEYSRADLKKFCLDQFKLFSKRQLILLDGDLGIGKTTLVQNFIQALGGESGESPTFSIINEYETNPKIFHVDLYRLESAEDIAGTGFWDIFDEPVAIIFVEWPQRVKSSDWPRSWSPVVWKMRPATDDKRKIFVEVLS